MRAGVVAAGEGRALVVDVLFMMRVHYIGA
jgi:hypothetical protein